MSSSTYDGDGLRVGAIGGANAPATYTWDVGSAMPQVLQERSNLYLYGLGRVSATSSATAQRYYHADGLGSTRVLTDETGAILNRYEYEAFGGNRATKGTASNPFRYTGEERDAGTALQYLLARFYDPNTGRFISEDPIGFAGGDANLYAYVGGDPANHVDPSGLCKVPGGSGVRYCIEAFIAVPNVRGLPVADDDGCRTRSDRGTYKTRQCLWSDGSGTPFADAGESPFLGIELKGSISGRGVMASDVPSGGRNFYATCRGMNGFSGPFGPAIVTNVMISEDKEGMATVKELPGTPPYPSLEVWQYRRGAEPRPVHFRPEGDHSILDLE